jgi:hypothetical protein
MRQIRADPADAGEATCPHCAGRLEWMKDGTNGHIHAQCDTPGCLRIMQ